jgi:hypothetical protein
MKRRLNKMVLDCPFKIGDLVVDKNADYKLSRFCICRVTGIEYIDELSDMWFEGVDESPYWFFETEVVYLKQTGDYMTELGDIICYEGYELVSLQEYLAQEPPTLDDYIQLRNSLTIHPD